MRQAISTRYIGPTNTQGSRVKAIARKREGNLSEISLADNWDQSASVEENHARVAKLLAARMDWAGLWIGGGSPENSGFVFVNIGDTVSPGVMLWHKEDRDYFVIIEREA